MITFKVALTKKNVKITSTMKALNIFIFSRLGTTAPKLIFWSWLCILNNNSAATDAPSNWTII